MEFNENLSNFDDYQKHIKKMEKEMFKIDVHRGGLMALEYDEFVNIFGAPNEEDMYDLCQSYIKLYLKQNDDNCVPWIVDMYSERWIQEFLSYNIKIEEYEICSILKDHLEIYKNNK